jgi:50S ribosomal protein L16 3-hydroxylase
MMRNMSILGRMSPATFLREHWHRRPLLVRQALPGFAGLLDRDALLQLATRSDATSRLVIDHGGRSARRRWERHDGPFAELDAQHLPAERWTVLVHGIESLVPGGWELLRRFDFIPAARIDDLMVSYAARGGSVGPHDDQYDVFLLQGPGRRRWQISRGGPRDTDPEAAIKVLRTLEPEDEWLLEPGDMLYLPPGVAHYGVAEDPCFTYSIGFLAPSHLDVAHSFLGYLGGALGPRFDGEKLIGSDVGTRPPAQPLALERSMVDEIGAVLEGLRWDRGVVEAFVGCFLTRPKPHVCFTPPARPLALERFAERLRGRGQLLLALASRGLVQRGRLYFNGEAHHAGGQALEQFATLVRERALPLPLVADEGTVERLYGWYLAGWLSVAATSRAAAPTRRRG